MKFSTLATTAAIALTSAAANSTSLAPSRFNTSEASHILSEIVYHAVGVDIVGKDISNLQMTTPLDCFTYCYSAPAMQSAGCSGVTWTPYQGGWCWTKRTGSKGTPTAVNGEAESFWVLSDTTSWTVWSETKNGFDIPGNDLTNVRGYSMGDCMTSCSNNRECYAVTWSGYNGGTCWLKRRANNYVASTGAMSAYVARRYSN